nr:hypothetical protein [uncultured Desulfobacter sp.]
MRSLETEFVLLLSNPDFSKKEVYNLKSKLKSGYIDDYFKKANKIKIILSDKKEQNEEETSNNTPELSVYEKQIVSQVEKLLRTEAKLTVKQAVQLLFENLELSPLSKRSFSDQILYLIQNRDGSSIINAAHKIRNEILHNKESDHWPLREL